MLLELPSELLRRRELRPQRGAHQARHRNPRLGEALRRLKDAAKVAFRDEVGRFDALFAAPDAVFTHTRPKTPKAKANGAAAPEGGQAAPAASKRAKPKARRGR